MSRALGALENLLGYKFSDLTLLERAVTHRSWAVEHHLNGDVESVRSSENESLEFVGDSVVGLIMAEQLFRTRPTAAEGELTLMKHYLVSTATLAKVAEGLELGSFLRIGRGEEKTGGRRKQALLANLMEAIIGAVFIDGGYVPTRQVVTRLFADEMKDVTPRTAIDFKSLLQETLQSEKLRAPSYRVLSSEGPPHERIFKVEAVWEGGKTVAKGNSIKSAEMAAAKLALDAIKLAGSAGELRSEKSGPDVMNDQRPDKKY